MIQLVLLRHGESIWNKENKFTGWTDVDLSEKGKLEAKKAGLILKQKHFSFDIVFTSVLKRAIRTTWIVLDEMDSMWIPVHCSWRLNERHYGCLQGMNKAEMAAKYGENQVLLWRRSYDIKPPALDKADERFPGNDPQYMGINKKNIPVTESLHDTVLRFLPYWREIIAPAIKANKRTLIVAHGNSLRGLIMCLEKKTADEILKVNIPTGIPLVYHLDIELNPIGKYYLGDQSDIQKAIDAVVQQGNAKKPLKKNS